MATTTKPDVAERLRMSSRYSVHTPESWARAIIAAATEKAASSSGPEYGKPVTFTAQITVSPMFEEAKGAAAGAGAAATPASHHQVGVCVQWGSDTYCVGVYAE